MCGTVLITGFYNRMPLLEEDEAAEDLQSTNN